MYLELNSQLALPFLEIFSSLRVSVPVAASADFRGSECEHD